MQWADHKALVLRAISLGGRVLTGGDMHWMSSRSLTLEAKTGPYSVAASLRKCREQLVAVAFVSCLKHMYVTCAVHVASHARTDSGPRVASSYLGKDSVLVGLNGARGQRIQSCAGLRRRSVMPKLDRCLDPGKGGRGGERGGGCA